MVGVLEGGIWVLGGDTGGYGYWEGVLGLYGYWEAVLGVIRVLGRGIVSI